MNLLHFIFYCVLIGNFFVSIIAFCFAFRLMPHRWRSDRIIFSFGSALICLGLWALNSIPYQLNLFPNITPIFPLLAYFFGAWLLFFVTWFAMLYPIGVTKSRVPQLLLLITIIFSLTLFFPWLYTDRIDVSPPVIFYVGNLLGVTFFGFLFVINAGTTLYHLVFSYFHYGGIHREKLSMLIPALSFSYLVNIFVNLSFFYFLTVNFYPVGALSTGFMLFVVYKIIYYK